LALIKLLCLVQKMLVQSADFLPFFFYTPLLWTFGRLGHLQPHFLGQGAHRLWKTHPQELYVKTNGVATHPTTKAVIELLGGTDCKRRCLFPMERTQAHQICPPLT